MSFNVFGQPSENKGASGSPYIPPPIKIPDAIPVIPGSESKIHQCVIKRIMAETLESNLSSVKKIKASKQPSSESVVASFELLLSTNDLFDEIVKSGGFTEENIEEIQQLRNEIEHQKLLLSEEDKSQSLLNIALAALKELDALQTAMQETATLEQEFLNILEAIESGTFSQTFSGESLLLPDLFLKGSEVLRQLWGKIYQYGEGSLARQSAEEMVDHGSKSLAFAVSEWEDNAIESIRQQRDLLLKAWGSGEDAEKSTSVALLSSLQAQLTAAQEIFAETQKQLLDHPYLERASLAVAQAHQAIGKELEGIRKAINKNKIALGKSSIPYGGEEWKAVAGDRFPKLAAEKDEAGWSLFHSERWSERTRRIVHSLLVGMQISQQAISAAQQIGQKGGSAEKTAEGASTAVGWFQTAIGKVTDVVKESLFPEQFRKEQEAAWHQQFIKEEFRFAEETIASTRKELFRAIDQAKEDRFPDQLAALFKIDRDLEIVLKSKPAETASERVVARWKSEAVNLCDRAAALLFKMKPVSRATMEEAKPANEAEARALLSLQSFVESPSLLPEKQGARRSGYELSDKVYQHLLGDFFGKDTGLEGYVSHEMLNYVLSLVSAKAASLKNNPLCQEDDKRDFCSSVFEVDKGDISLEMFSRLEKQLADAAEMQLFFEGENPSWYTEAFKLRTFYLKPGESFFFLGGWQGKTTGHAVVYEVIRQNNGLLTFRIYNRGEGADRYAQAMLDGKEQMMSFGEIVDISDKSLTNLLFLHGLREMNVRPTGNEKDWTDFDFYTKLLSILDGKISHRVYTKDQMMRLLQVGHCSYLSLTALMNFQLGDKLTYTHWEVEMQFKTLWDYFLLNQPILSRDELNRRLLREGFVQFSRNLAEARKHHIVSDAEAVWIGNQLKTVEIALITAESEALKQAVAVAPIVEIHPIEGSLSGCNAHDVRFNSPYSSNTTYVPAISKYLDRSDWRYRPETFTNDLQNLLADTREFNSMQITSVKLAIETFLSRVPLSGEVFWKGMSSEEAILSLDRLGELARSYLTINAAGRSKFGEREMVFAEDQLAMMKILTLADALAKDFKEKWGVEFPDLFQNSMRGVLNSASTSSGITDPVWEEERRLMRDYWMVNREGEFEFGSSSYVSFFGFENGYRFVHGSREGSSRTFHRFSDVPPGDQYYDEKLRWGDIEFAKRWVQRREIADKLPLDFEALGDVHQAVLLLSEGYDQVPFALPPQFFSLKAVSQAFYYSHCHLDLDIDHYTLLFPAESIKLMGDTVVLTDKGKQFVISEDYIIPIGDTWKTVDPLNPLELTQGKNLHSPFLEKLERFSFKSVDDQLSNSYVILRDRIPPHDRMIISLEEHGDGPLKITEGGWSKKISTDTSFFETQEFLSLSSVKSLQIQETFAFFSLNSHLLSERRYQEMFSYLMTENSLFIDELLKDPEQTSQFVFKLATFCKEQVRVHKGRSDSGSMLYFLELHVKFSSLVDFTKAKYPGAFPAQFSTPFEDICRDIREIANNKNAVNTDRQYAHYLSMVSAAQHQVLTERDVQDLLLGMIYFDIYGLPPNQKEPGVIKVSTGYEQLGALSEPDSHRWDPSKTKQIREMLVSNHVAMRNVLSDTVVRNRILNEVIRFYEPHFIPKTWNPMPAYPYFESADGVYVLDMEKGALFIDGGGLRVFPKTERENTFVKYVLGDEQDVLVKRSVDGTLEFRDKRGNEYVFQEERLYRKFGKEWYQANEPDKGGALGGSWNYRLIPRQSSFIWQGVNPDNELPNVDGLRQRFSDYRSGRKVRPDHLVSYIEEIKTHQLKYKISEQRDPGKAHTYRTTEIQLLDERGKEAGKVLTENHRSCYEFLERVENYEDILIWQDKQTKHPFRIELPRYDFSFSIKKYEGEWTAFSDKYPDLHLAKLQHIPQLGDITSYLVLEDGKGGKFALIPELPFRELAVPLITETPLDRKGGSRLFLLRINSDGSDIVPESREDRYKLASLFLSERDYDRAMKYLRGYGALLSPLTVAELEALKRIINFPNINKDRTPEASAVRLYAQLLSKKRDSHGDREAYSRQLDQLGNLRLRPEEEKELGIGNQKAERLPAITSEILLKKPFFEGKGGLLDAGLKNVLVLVEAISYGEIDPYTDELALRKRQIELGLEPTAHIPKGSVLRPDLRYSFAALYTHFKNQRFDERSAVLFNDITGLELPSDTDPMILKERFRQILTFVLMSTDEDEYFKSMWGIGSYEDKQVLAATLLAVMDDPDAFPSLELIIRQPYAVCIEFIEKEKILEKVLERWKAPPEMPQGKVEVVATAPSGLPAKQNIQLAPLTPAHLMSVQLNEGFPLQFSGAAHLDRVVEWVPPHPDEVSKIRDAGAALSKVFDVVVSDPIAIAKYRQIQSKIAESAEKRGAASGHYRLKSVEALNTLKAQLLAKANQLEPVLESQEKLLLALANKPYESESLEVERNARIAGRLEKRLSITELFHMFRTRDKEAIARRNPALSADEIEQMFEMIREHLETITLHQHQLRMLKLISDIEKKPGPVELQALVDEFSVSAKANRQYDVVNHPEYLNLEQNGNILIRRDQVDNLEKMARSEARSGTTSRNGAALEAIPGSGKTSVLLIEQALNAADGEHLSLVVIPETLMPSMSVDIQETFGDAYGTLIVLIGFDRNSPSDAASLRKIDDILSDAITNKKVVLMTDKSLQSFFLEYVKKAYNIMKSERSFSDDEMKLFKEYEKELEVMEATLHKFFKLGIATLDEIDLILDALRSHHFTIGSPQPLKLEVAEAVSGLYNFLATNSAIQKAIKFPFLSASTSPAFTEQRYREVVLPVLVGKVLDGTILGKDKEMQTFLNALTNEEKVLVETYLHAKKDPEAIAFFKGIESVRIKNILAILKEEINVLLPLTASKKVNEHFGPMPSESGTGRSTKSDLSIPYRGSNNPVKGSEHGTDLEIVNHSIEMNMALGVTEQVVAKEIENIKKMTEEELTLRGAKRLEECEGYAIFIDLCGGETKFNLFKLTEEDIREITAIVNKSPKAKMELITKYVIPQVKTYPVELSSSGELYAFLLHLVKGFTGTLWNDESFPNIFYGAIESDTMAKTLNILWEKSPKAIPAIDLPSMQQTPSGHAKLLVDKLYSREGGFKGCFADSGGIFREIEDNSLVAREILRHQPETIKGVVYYDQQGHLMVWTRKGEAEPLERTRLTKEELAAFWDQQHTTGSDIKLGLTMKGTVSIGRYTMMRDLIQSVWRMRGLEKGQQVDFVVSGEDLQVIRETLKRVFGREVGETLGLDDLFLYALQTQISRQGEDVYRTLKSKLNGVLIRKVMEVIADPGEPDVDKPKIIYATRSLFVDETVKEPYEVYGGIAEEIDSKAAVENEVNKVLNGAAFKAFSTLDELSKRYSADAIKAELEEVAARELAKIPPKVKQNTAYEKEVAVEVETETGTEKEKEKEKATSKHKSTEGEQYTHPRPVIDWPYEAAYSSKAYLPGDVEMIKGMSRHLPHGQSIVFPVNPVLAGDLLTKDYGDIFDENLLSTMNFMPIHLPDDSKQLIYHPFGRFHDVVSNLIVVEDLKTGALKLVIGNQEDVKALDEGLADDLQNPKRRGRDVRVCIYNLENGVIRQGSDRFDVDQLEKNAEFMRLKTQAKFFAGYVTYSTDEQKVLREWFKEKGPERMLKFFREVVLAEKETRQAQYHRSTIQRVFDELLL